MATFYSELLIKNGSDYVLNNMTDPDEYANGGKTRATRDMTTQLMIPCF